MRAPLVLSMALVASACCLPFGDDEEAAVGPTAIAPSIAPALPVLPPPSPPPYLVRVEGAFGSISVPQSFQPAMASSASSARYGDPSSEWFLEIETYETPDARLAALFPDRMLSPGTRVDQQRSIAIGAVPGHLWDIRRDFLHVGYALEWVYGSRVYHASCTSRVFNPPTDCVAMFESLRPPHSS